MRAKYIKVNRNKQQSPKTQTKKKKKTKTKQNKTKQKKKNLKKHLTDKPYKRAETLKKTQNNRL